MSHLYENSEQPFQGVYQSSYQFLASVVEAYEYEKDIMWSDHSKSLVQSGFKQFKNQ